MTEDLNNIKNIVNNSTFYRAVVEDNKDPLKLNRVRVRVMGIHADDIENIPTDTLPWAEVLAPSLFGLSSGIGFSGVPNNGSYVWVFFDGEGYNQPIVFGTSYGISKEKEEGAFVDPDGVFPVEGRLKEPDTNRLARNEVLNKTAIGIKNSEREIAVPMSGGGTWDEPAPLNYRTKYPNNTVLETKSGHIVEIDDTPGNERIHVYHKTGTYLEFLPDGSVITKTVGDKYEIIKQDLFCLIEGSRSETVLGSTEELISDNQQIVIGADAFTNIGGQSTLIIGSTYDVTSGGDTSIKAPKIYLN
jgi:hypothetical protein